MFTQLSHLLSTQIGKRNTFCDENSNPLLLDSKSRDPYCLKQKRYTSVFILKSFLVLLSSEIFILHIKGDCRWWRVERGLDEVSKAISFYVVHNRYYLIFIKSLEMIFYA